MLTNEEVKRYARHLQLPEIGVAGQLKLKQARVLVIGAGGLGCPILQYLTAAGVGIIGIVEFDNVDESNLQRQILYTVDDIGKPKIESAIHRLSQQNTFVKFVPHAVYLTNKNALDIIENYDVIVDGTDNFATRYLVNDACVLLNKILVYGSISRFEGQVTVFNYPEKNGERGPTYRCLFPEPPPPESSPNCSEVGVMGVLPGIIGAIQANEIIKIITGIGKPLSGKLFMMNVLNIETYTVSFVRNKDALPLNRDEFEEMDYHYFCNTTSDNINEITVSELKELLKNNNSQLQLLDVRELNEQPFIEELKDVQIPSNEILKNVNRISSDKKVIVYCKTGARSTSSIQLLQKEKGLTNLFNLKGGVDEWIKNFKK